MSFLDKIMGEGFVKELKENSKIVKEGGEEENKNKVCAVDLEDFCRDFYDNQILNQVVGGVDLSSAYPDYIKENLNKLDNVFVSIDSQKLKDEIIILRFELFALAFLHQFGEDLAITQSIFTNRYLRDNKREDIWEGMAEYNTAISHSTTAEKGNKVAAALIYKARADSFDKYVAKGQSMGVDFDNNNYQLESISLSVNRFFSEKAWKKGATVYFLILALCHRLGLGYGPNYTGPNKKAQIFLTTAIKGLYDGAQQSWDGVKIKD